MVFSILFFVFTILLTWSKLGDFVGKGLSIGVIFRMIYLLSFQQIPMIVPLTVLLASIMTYGGLGERYELAVIKSTGISLSRAMAPLFFITVLISLGLFYMTDSVIPKAEIKAKNLLYNVIKTNPSLQIREGFFTEIPGYDFKIKEKYGEDGNRMRDIFVHSRGNSQSDIQTIRAKDGVFSNSPDQKYLILELFDGEYYIDQRKGKSIQERSRQPFINARFDTLVQYIDVSKLKEKDLNKERIGNYYRFHDTKGLFQRLDSLNDLLDQQVEKTSKRSTSNYNEPLPDEDLKQEPKEKIKSDITKGLIRDDSIGEKKILKTKKEVPSDFLSWSPDSLKLYQQLETITKTGADIVKNSTEYSKQEKKTEGKIKSNLAKNLILEESAKKNLKAKKEVPAGFLSWSPDSLKLDQQIILYTRVAKDIRAEIEFSNSNEGRLSDKIKTLAKYEFKAHENIAFPLTCIIFFLIGSSLGSIIRKGGLGVPSVVAIAIFIIYLLVYTFGRNFAKNGVLDAAWAAWLGNLTMFPIGIWFTYQSMRDSSVFNIQNYTEPLLRFIRKFRKNKDKEHIRYQ